MIVKLHKNARTTPAIRAQLAASNESVAVLAKRFNLAPNTVRKWQARTDFNDRSHTAHNLQTTLSSAQEHIVIYLRKHLLLPLDDLLSVTQEFLCPEVSRSGLNRCLRRHGVGNLREMTRSQDNKPKYQRFKDYPIGFVHIDIKYLPQMADESKRKYLFVAIDRATRMVCVQLRESKTAKDAREFLKFVTERFPFEIKKVLTDNGKEFTNKVFGNNATNKTHEFDDLCLSLGIEHRLTRVRRPQTNGMVERFNGRIADILRTHHFQSGKELEHTIMRYVDLYNNHLPQANLNCRTPCQVMYEWYVNKPQFFDKVVHNRPEGDSNSKYRKWVKLDNTDVPELDVEAIEAQESRLDGVRGIFTSLSTEASQASAIKARYAELWRIEHGFRVLKSDLRMRPIFHWKEERIKAHVAICFTAYVLLSHLHYRVNRSAGDLGRLSPAAILDHLSDVQVNVVTDTNSGRQLLVPSKTTREQQAIYTAAGAKLVRTTVLCKRAGSGQNSSKNE